MSEANKTDDFVQWSHTDITLGPRGANCLACGWFLYSQVDNYKDREFVVATLNLPEDRPTQDVVPFEYYNTLLKEEQMETYTYPFNFSRKVISIRKKLIDYVIELGDRFKQSNLTIHIAVVYLDKALAKYSDILLKRLANASKDKPYEDHSNLWAIVALMLASKYDEIDRRIPFYKEIIRASSRAAKYTEDEFHTVEEFFVKSVFKWEFHTITTLHFTHSLITQGILFEDDDHQHTQERTLKSLRKKAELFTDLSLDSERLVTSDYSKSKIAVACIVAARKIWGIKPLWNNKLYNMTSYHFFDIKEILEILIKEYWVFFNEEYSQIMQTSEFKRPKNQQRPQSFINRRASEKPKLYGKLTHIKSTKSLKVKDEVIPVKPSRNTMQNCDMKSAKLDACEGDSFTSNWSIPDENETDADTIQEFTKINEKCTTRSGTLNSEESEPIKIYIMKFKSMVTQDQGAIYSVSGFKLLHIWFGFTKWELAW